MDTGNFLLYNKWEHGNLEKSVWFTEPGINAGGINIKKFMERGKQPWKNGSNS